MMTVPITSLEAEALTPEQRLFVYWRSLGLTGYQAYRRAYPNATEATARVNAVKTARHPGVQAALEVELQANRERYNIDRDVVVNGLMEAISIARDRADPTAMIMGWKEVARVALPDAPPVEKGVNGPETPADLAAATEDELLRVLNKRRHLRTRPAIEGEVVGS